MKTLPPAVFTIIFSIFVLAILARILFEVSKLLSWRRLAISFPGASKPQGQIFNFASAVIGGLNYNNALTIVVSDQGLFLQPWFPIRTFNRPLLIPWNAFSPFVKKQSLLAKRYESTITTRDGGSEKIVLTSKPMVEAVQTKISTTSI